MKPGLRSSFLDPRWFQTPRIQASQRHREILSQNRLCNDLATEAKVALDEGDEDTAGRALFKVKLGQPRNRQFMRFMEDPDTRRLIEKTELSFYQDAQKKELFAIKEELYFTIDEKGHDAD